MCHNINQTYTLKNINPQFHYSQVNKHVNDPNIHKEQLANIVIHRGFPMIKQATLGFAPKETQLRNWNLNYNKKTYNTYNARLETVADNTLYTKAYDQHHCLIPVTCFYKWTFKRSQFTPYSFALKSGPVTYLAGLYNVYADNGINNYGFSIITQAVENFSQGIERFPVVLQEQQCMSWLKNDLDITTLAPPQREDYKKTRVSRILNNSRVKSAQRIFHVG